MAMEQSANFSEEVTGRADSRQLCDNYLTHLTNSPKPHPLLSLQSSFTQRRSRPTHNFTTSMNSKFLKYSTNCDQLQRESITYRTSCSFSWFLRLLAPICARSLASLINLSLAVIHPV